MVETKYYTTVLGWITVTKTLLLPQFYFIIQFYLLPLVTRSMSAKKCSKCFRMGSNTTKRRWTLGHGRTHKFLFPRGKGRKAWKFWRNPKVREQSDRACNEVAFAFYEEKMKDLIHTFGRFGEINFSWNVTYTFLWGGYSCPRHLRSCPRLHFIDTGVWTRSIFSWGKLHVLPACSWNTEWIYLYWFFLGGGWGASESKNTNNQILVTREVLGPTLLSQYPRLINVFVMAHRWSIEKTPGF